MSRDRERSGPARIEPAVADLQAELRAAVRDRVLPQYANRDPHTLRLELEAIGRDRFRPIPADAFEALRKYAVRGDELKWVVTSNGELLFGPTNYTHASLAAGEPVLAAGQAHLCELDRQRKQFLVLEISNTSGHYQPPAPSLEVAVRLFRTHGFEVPDQAKQTHSNLFSS